jgi:hypothetical protein
MLLAPVIRGVANSPRIGDTGSHRLPASAIRESPTPRIDDTGSRDLHFLKIWPYLLIADNTSVANSYQYFSAGADKKICR